MPAGSQHLEHISPRSCWPRKVFKDLIGNDEVHLRVQRLRTDVKVRKLCFGIGTKVKDPLPLRAGSDLKNIEFFWTKRTDEFEASAIHYHSNPIRRIESNIFQTLPDFQSGRLVRQPRFND
jgi:hypothetical protein